MPSTYAHYKLGRDAAALLAPEELAVIQQAPQLYSIGLHGPDLLFYYKPLSSNPVNRLGHDMHNRPGRTFFEAAAKVVREHPDSPGHLAYLYGFLCHFALDTVCHGYIARKEARSGISHAEIESELERVLMLADGLDPVRHKTTGHLIPSEENAAVIADFFPGVTQAEVLDALKGMVFYLDLLVAPSAFKRQLIFTALRLAGHYPDMHGLVISPTPNPACADSNAELLRRFGGSARLAARLIGGYHTVLETGHADAPVYGRTFDPKPPEQEAGERRD